MPLTIGIKNGLDKGFTKEELELTNGFAFGVVCMHAGVSRIGEKGYRTIVSAEEAQARFKLVLDTMPIWGDQENSFPYKWLTDLDNIKRLEEHDWYCNAGTKTRPEFVHHMRKVIFDEATKDTMFKYSWSPTWSDLDNQKDALRIVIGAILSGEDKEYHDDNTWLVEHLTDSFEPWDYFDLSKPFYNNKYLVYDEDECRYKLAKEPQEE